MLEGGWREAGGRLEGWLEEKRLDGGRRKVEDRREVGRWYEGRLDRVLEDASIGNRKA